MNYFGTSKRVKVEQGVTPRDFDRSKVFTQVPPVINKKFTVRCQVGSHSNVLVIIRTFLQILVTEYRYTDFCNYFEIDIEANYIQVEKVEAVLGVIEVKEIK